MFRWESIRQIIIKSILNISISKLYFSVIELPLEHGKTPIFACLAKYLADKYSESKIIVVTMNNNLGHHSYENYSIKRLR